MIPVLGIKKFIESGKSLKEIIIDIINSDLPKEGFNKEVFEKADKELKEKNDKI